MEKGEFIKMNEQSGSHWWYAARRGLLKFSLEKSVSGKENVKILDLASACGDNFSVCSDFGSVYGIDISPVSISFCKEKNIKTIVQGDVQKLPFQSDAFDVVVALDVFEHLDDDVLAFEEIRRVLKNNGRVIFNVPSCASLFSYHDRAFQHVRRYDSRSLRRKLKEADFRIEFMAHWSFFIFPVVFLKRKILPLKKRPAEDVQSDFHIKLPPIFEKILKNISLLELFLIKHNIRFPFGVSLFGIGKKNG